MPEFADPRPAIFAETDRAAQRFLDFIDDLTSEQWQTPTDPAGWNVKDHVIHCAMWAGSLVAVIDKKPRWEAMAVPLAVWETVSEDYDRINAVIWQNNRHLTPEEARQVFVDAYQKVISRVGEMSVGELYLPYSHFQELAETETHPIDASGRGDIFMSMF